MTKTGSKHIGVKIRARVTTSLLLRHREISEIYKLKLRSLTLYGYLVIKSGFLLTDTISVRSLHFNNYCKLDPCMVRGFN